MPETLQQLLDRAAALPCFTAPTRVAPLEGGKTNLNLLVEDGGARFVVRFGADIPEHGILRWNELAVSRAAEAAGIGPAVRHAAPGVMVVDFVEARPLTSGDRADPATIPALADLLRRVHHDVFARLDGPVLSFWVFHILRDYARRLSANDSAHIAILPGLMDQAAALEAAIGPTPTVLGHNDLLPGNILKGDGRFWLIDWEYAGLGSPLFDLGGIASNNGFTGAEELALLAAYHGQSVSDALWRQYTAMKCASLLRETLWSMVSERTSALDFDYGAYTAENLAAFRAAYHAYQSL